MLQRVRATLDNSGRVGESEGGAALRAVLPQGPRKELYSYKLFEVCV